MCKDSEHHFEPRYDKEPAKVPSEYRFHDIFSVEGFRKVTYLGDICTRCGAWQERPNPLSR